MISEKKNLVVCIRHKEAINPDLQACESCVLEASETMLANFGTYEKTNRVRCECANCGSTWYAMDTVIKGTIYTFDHCSNCQEIS